MTELSDHELLARFASRRGEKAFSVLVDRYLPAVREVARSRTGDADTARDPAQEAFVLLARQAGQLRPGTIVTAASVAAVSGTAAARRSVGDASVVRPFSMRPGAPPIEKIRTAAKAPFSQDSPFRIPLILKPIHENQPIPPSFHF